jgi:hypothetical protein
MLCVEIGMFSLRKMMPQGLTATMLSSPFSNGAGIASTTAPSNSCCAETTMTSICKDVLFVDQIAQG